MSLMFSDFLAKFLFSFACLALVLHIGSCFLVAMRRPRQNLRVKSQGVTLICPLDGLDRECQSQALNSAFAETYHKKEIIFCAIHQDKASLAEIRSLREAHKDKASLLIISPMLENKQGEEQVGDNVNALRQCLVKAWKAARYDYLITALPNANLPPDYIMRFFNTEKRTVKEETKFACAVLWAVHPLSLQQRLKTVFFNSFRARRLALADSFGKAIASDADCLGGAVKMSPALWHYDMFPQMGGIDNFMQNVEIKGSGAAITELIFQQKGRIYLTARPLSLNLGGKQNREEKGKSSFVSLLKEQLAWLKIYRHFLPYFFYSELLLTPFLPIFACAAAFVLGLLSLSGLLGFIGLWYAAELVFCALWQSGKSGGLRTYIFLPLRDILLVVLWFYAARTERKMDNEPLKSFEFISEISNDREHR